MHWETDPLHIVEPGNTNDGFIQNIQYYGMVYSGRHLPLANANEAQI